MNKCATPANSSRKWLEARTSDYEAGGSWALEYTRQAFLPAPLLSQHTALSKFHTSACGQHRSRRCRGNLRVHNHVDTARELQPAALAIPSDGAGHALSEVVFRGIA
jgi:hypothetical protein